VIWVLNVARGYANSGIKTNQTVARRTDRLREVANRYNKYMVLLTHMSGNQNVRNALAALKEADLLDQFHTSVYWDSDHTINKWLPSSVRSELNRRSYPQVARQDVCITPVREVARILARRVGLNILTDSDRAPLSAARVCEYFDLATARAVRRRRPKAVYAYEGAALQTFRAARCLGAICIYELPSGYWYYDFELLREEAALRPEYADTMPILSRSSNFLKDRDEELELADHIVFPSDHVRRTLQRAPVSVEKLHKVPYGTDESKGPTRALGASRERKLRVLFVGALTQRKGIGYLLDALNLLGSSVEFTMVGPKNGQSACIDAAIRQHRWIPSIPHSAVLDEMARNDVLVLPSLTEAYGLVILEALSRGLPVITTTSTGGPEIIRDGQDGFFVPIRSAEAIAQKLELLDHDRGLLDHMSASATQRARQFTWQRYRNSLISTLNRILA
jgi:alpha-maltose-1-phosphate synthase